jgi:uncharacterized membrane protein
MIGKVAFSALFVVFSFSLVVAHYGLTYLFLICLIVAFLVASRTDRPFTQNITKRHFGRPKDKGNGEGYREAFSTSKNRNVSVTLVVLLFIITFTWYSFAASASPFTSVLIISGRISGSILGNLNPATVQGLAVLTTGVATPLRLVARYVTNASNLIIAVGLLAVTLKFYKKRFSGMFLGFSLASFCLLLASIVLPYFASSLNISRLYQIALVFLAPFLVIGWFVVAKMICKTAGVPLTEKRTKQATIVLSVFLATVLLFNTGFVYQVTGDPPTSIALSSKIDYPVYNQKENSAAVWIFTEKDTRIIFADLDRFELLNRFDPTIANVTSNVASLNDSYAFLGTYNIVQQSLVINSTNGPVESSNLYKSIVGTESKVYDNGGGQIFANS